MASLSNIGLGSNGALSHDVIDKLKKVDTNNQINPIDKKITKNSQKISDLSILTTLTASLKSATSSLSDETAYLQREANVSGSSTKVSVSAGTTIQDFSLDVTKLAKQDIIETKSFLTKSSSFTSSADTISISIDGKSYDIDVNSGTSLEDLRNKINDNTDEKVIASILNVGGDNPYKLILKSATTGDNQAISMTSAGSGAYDLGIQTFNYTADTPTGTYTGTDTLTFTLASGNYTIDVEDGDSITQINSKISELNLGKELSSKIENGVLVLDSSYNNLSVSGNSTTTFGLDTLTKNTSTAKIQEASDSSFLYNGINITRSSNKFDDLIVGLNITLTEKGLSNVSVTQDTTDITTNLKSFVSKYNELMNNLNETTKYDTETKASGSFQGNSQINSLKSTINRELLSIDSKGRNLASYGIELNESGMLEFKLSEFNAKMTSNPDDIKNYFVGNTTYDTTLKVGTLVNSGAIDLTTNDFSINGTNIVVNLNGTASENALALKNAINSANIFGVKAILDDSNSYITLRSTSGEDIKIEGDSAKLASIGLSSGTTRGTSETTTGIFTEFNGLLKNLSIGSDSMLGLFEKILSKTDESLKLERTKSVKSLDDKYAIMAARFIAYDSIISKLNSQFKSLSMMIESSYNKK